MTTHSKSDTNLSMLSWEGDPETEEVLMSARLVRISACEHLHRQQRPSKNGR